MNRDDSLERIDNAKEAWDIVVVGGGATGLGCAVDAAARGYKVALLEQADFAKGTSSRSTKLVHGGVRYLKQGNVSLVLEALKERGLLCGNAPHLARHQSFIVPIYNWWEGPFYGVGMKVYDALAGRLGLEPSRPLTKRQTLEQIPTLEQEDLLGGVIYYDGQFDDARLAVNLAQTVEDLGGTVLNYAKVTGLTKKDGFVSGVTATDLESGRELTLPAKCVINACGVFSDGLRQMDAPQAPKMIAASQGVHLVLPKTFVPRDAAIMVPHTTDGRVLFAVPWHDYVIVGTTDTPRDEISLEPRALEEEIDFILTNARRYMHHDPHRRDVLSVYAGLRPLVKHGDGGNTAALSRDHTIVVSESGLLTITGGKWTTYRKMAEDAIDHAEPLAGFEHRPCRTHHLPIHGSTTQKVDGPSLIGLYGSDAPAIMKLANEDHELIRPIHQRLPYTYGELLWSARHEMARTVDDLLARRTRALLLDAKAAIEAAPAAAELLAGELHKDSVWAQKTAEDFIENAQGYLVKS